jgi:hypothetical protein
VALRAAGAPCVAVALDGVRALGGDDGAGARRRRRLAVLALATAAAGGGVE